MYVRLITFQVKPDVTKEQAGEVYNLLLSEMRGYRGFQGLSVLINEAAHRAISLSYWQDEESAAEAGTRSLPLLMEKSEPLIDRPPEISGYELLRHEVFPA